MATAAEQRRVRKVRATYMGGVMAARGYTRASLAFHLNLDQSYISRIISGDRTPSLEVAVGLAAHIGVPLAELADAMLGRAPATTEVARD